MEELGAILRTSNEPADGAASMSSFGSLAGHFSSRDPALYPLHVNTGTLPKPYTVCFIRQIAHPDAILNRRLPASALPPGDRGLSDAKEPSEIRLQKPKLFSKSDRTSQAPAGPHRFLDPRVFFARLLLAPAVPGNLALGTLL